MLKIQEFMCALEEFAPLALSRKRIEAGDYDNSGLLVDAKRDVQRVLFSLDLTAETAVRAAKLKCDTVVTHHPAIYGPLSRITAEDPVFFAIRHGLNVISMHLNLDYAPGGTDESLAQALGAESNGCRITENEGGGYGREFAAGGRPFGEFAAAAVKAIKCRHFLSYGGKNDPVNVCASFAGAGGGVALKALENGWLKADTVVTSDVPHHLITKFIESGKKLLVISHYAAENYGFERFFERVKAKVAGSAETMFFTDKRFL